MSKLLAFLGGAAEGLSTEIEKAEKSAKEEAMLRVKKLSESYEETKKANRELTNSLNAEKDWIKTTYSDATPEQIAYLQGSPAALQALKKMKDPTKISLSDVISIASGNESNAVIDERITAMPEVADKVSSAIKNQYRAGLGGVIDRIAEGTGETSERRFARAMGSDIETLQNTKLMQRPTATGTFDMAKTLAETPNSVEDMVKAANVTRVQAKQKFGENSPEYKAASQAYTDISKEIDKTDKGLQARADRLNIAVMDEQDPITKKALQKDLQSTQQAIKDHKEATSTRAERRMGDSVDKTKLSGIQKSVGDFVNTRMREDKGFDWAKHVDFKEIPLPDGGVYVSTTVKSTLSPEKQREVFEKIRMLEADALKTNGYIIAGAPRTEYVKEFINNRNIPTQYYSGKTPTESTTQQTPPVPSTPAAIPTAPASTKVDQARADANAAIARGANRAAVSARFKQATGQEL